MLFQKKTFPLHTQLRAIRNPVPWMSGLVSGLQNRVRRFESARNLVWFRLLHLYNPVPWMSGLVSGLQNRVRRFESARNLRQIEGLGIEFSNPFLFGWMMGS